MTDLTDVLPDFDLRPWRHLIFSLEKNGITVSELISLDPVEIVRRCPLPFRDLCGMINAIVNALHIDLGLKEVDSDTDAEHRPSLDKGAHKQNSTSRYSLESCLCLKTLDTNIDNCLGGGIFTRHVTEIVGESAVGKTQFALGLLLSAQLPPPQGLGKSAIYVSTESPLRTTRLAQILCSNPAYEDLPENMQPSLDRVYSIEVRRLEEFEQVIHFQLPIAVKKFNPGLVVVDSVAAIFRAEFETTTVKGLTDRATQLVRLGNALKQVARENNTAVVVINQVSDRFDDSRVGLDRLRTSSPMTGSSQTSSTPKDSTMSSTPMRKSDVLSLDHQQRYFTGWGSGRHDRSEQLKTPALGLTWANHISARIVLKMDIESETQPPRNNRVVSIAQNTKRRRLLQVVFAPWVETTLEPIEYELRASGVASVTSQNLAHVDESVVEDEEYAELLDPRYWTDGSEDDEEYL